MTDSRTDSPERLTEELEATQASSARRAYLLSAVGHDLKNPLFGICLQAEVAEHSLDSGDLERVRAALRDIRQCGTQATAQLDRYLELSRLSRLEDEPPSLEPISIGALIDLVVQRVRTLATDSKARLDIPEQSPVACRADPQRVEQILVWILDVTIRRVPRGTVRVTVSRNADAVEIRVIGESRSDQAVDGGGAPGHDDRHRQDEMGLMMARRLAVQTGGGVESDDQPSTGLRWSLTLPGASEEQGVLRAGRVEG